MDGPYDVIDNWNLKYDLIKTLAMLCIFMTQAAPVNWLTSPQTKSEDLRQECIENWLHFLRQGDSLSIYAQEIRPNTNFFGIYYAVIEYLFRSGKPFGIRRKGDKWYK